VKTNKNSTASPHTDAPNNPRRRNILTTAALLAASFSFSWLLPQTPAASAPESVAARSGADETTDGEILSVLLEVDTESLLEIALQQLLPNVRTELRKERVRYSHLRREGDRVSFRLRKADQAFVAYAALERLGGEYEIGKPDKGIWSVWPTETEIAELRERTIRSVLVLLTGRIAGVFNSQPAPLIRRVGTSNRILVQYPEGYKGQSWDWSSGVIDSRALMRFYLIEKVTSHSELESGYEKSRRDVLRPQVQTDDTRYIVNQKRSRTMGVEAIRNADVVVNHDGTVQLEIRMKDSAKRHFASMINRQTAITIGNEVLAAPSVSNSVEHADILILKGDLSLAYAKKLANIVTVLIGYGRLKVVREWTVKAGYNIDEISGR